MLTLVDRPGFRIEVRDGGAPWWVCVTCRGSGDRVTREYESGPYGELPRLVVFGRYPCPSCGGVGFDKSKEV